MNEILLVLSLLVIYGSVLLVYRLFGKMRIVLFYSDRYDYRQY